MISKWFRYKEKAIQLRKSGQSIRKIERSLGISRSTLSGWFKNIQLTQKQKEHLDKNRSDHLVFARKEAVKWHREQKKIRLEEAKSHAASILSHIDVTNEYIMELIVAMLYLGEGAKTPVTALGNSNPALLKYFILCLKTLYKIKPKELKCELHLRADQNVDELKKYWSTQLKIPVENFRASIDRRTLGSKTYHNYKGVCAVVCGKIAPQRKMLYLIDEYFKKLSIHGVIAQW